MTPAPLLVVRELDKSFGATRALRAAALEVAPGEIHALVGENGAGKSTLIKILAGAHTADRGEIFFRGAPYRPRDPLDARRHGIATCYQELAVARHLTVAENIMLGQEISFAGVIRRAPSRRRVRDLLQALEQSHIPAGRLAGDLPIAAQQFVEIARAIAADARLIILDEPTSSLAQADARHLFGFIRRLRAEGVSFLYVSHFLEEIIELCDRYTVMRDGQSVAAGRVAESSIDQLVALMVGRQVDELYPPSLREPGDVRLRVEKLTGIGGKPDAASLDLRGGEIVGIGGLVGSGRSELLRTIYGLRRAAGGSITLDGGPDLARAAPADRLRAGLGFASEDRKSEGLALQRSLAENIALGSMRRVARAGWIRRRLLRAEAARAAADLSTLCRDIGQRAADLSGGNQQKIALARLLFARAAVLMLDEPTRGVDIGAKAVIYEWLRREAAAGKAILITSSYWPELLGVCDRVGVMFRGRLVALAPRGHWNDERLLLAASTGLSPVEEPTA